MIKTQQIIKYIAIGFALCLAINIISLIIFGIITAGRILTNENNPEISETIENKEPDEKLENQEMIKTIDYIDIDIKDANIFIKIGPKLKVETNDKEMVIQETENKLTISKENKKWFAKDIKNLIVYIPENYELKEVSIENNNGKLYIEKIKVEEIEIDLGVGNIEIGDITANKAANINSGVGDIKIKNGNINWLDTDIGVGNTSITTSITTIAEISAGVGNFELNLLEDESNFKIIVENLGKSTLNNNKLKNDTYYGDGSKLIDISGGVGNIKITTK